MMRFSSGIRVRTLLRSCGACSKVSLPWHSTITASSVRRLCTWKPLGAACRESEVMGLRMGAARLYREPGRPGPNSYKRFGSALGEDIFQKPFEGYSAKASDV